MTAKQHFDLIKDEEVAELNTKAKLYRHKETGAEVLSLENDDENKVFGITFRTPPTDSTGIAHIMEHSVLCGSRKYPVKEPFVELIKGSLKTFLNAFTFPDKTCYPVASTNDQDFYNLIDVYLDAVFYPHITPETLQQEGWHYELDDPAEPMVYKGVVFNEMKGAYSSPEGVLGRYSQEIVFPDNTYGVDSGGDPEHIPNLTYEQFKTFHDTYYHPSNARIFFYGDDDPDKRFDLIQDYLKDFDAIDVNSAVVLQSPFDEPKHVTIPYDTGDDESPQKAYVTVNWLMPETIDTTLTLSLSILSYMLVSTPASPLRKALIDSGLGEDTVGGGLEGQLRQMVFSTGLKGVALDQADQVEPLILDTLGKLVADGIDPDLIEAAFNTFEFRLRENNTGSFPRGISLMLRSLSTWLYDSDPIGPLKFETPLAAIRAHLDADDHYFENLIDQHLLQNQHRVTLTLEPDATLRQRQEAAEVERLAQAKAAMSQADIETVIKDTAKLKRMQETPDPPEALAKIPSLTLADIDKVEKTIPIDISESYGAKILHHDLFTNGIVYLNVGFNLHTLPQELLPYVSLFGQTLTKIGTESEDFVKLSQRIGRKTGGIWTSALTSAVKDKTEGIAWLFLRGKATMGQTDDLLDLLRDMLLTVNLDNRERFRQMVLEEKAGEEAGLIPGGHGVVDTRLRAKFNEADWADEQMHGLNYLFFLRQLAQDVDNDWPKVLAKLKDVRRTLLNRDSMLVDVTLDADNWGQFQSKLHNFLSTLPFRPASLAFWTPHSTPAFEGLTIPAKVNYVGKGANLYDLGYHLHGSHLVITNFLRTTWLWERVRVQGGAYGGFCRFDSHSGVFNYLSYRDPNLLKTLDNYDAASQFLRQLDLSQDELTKSIIGAIGQIDAYQLPDAKGYTSMLRYLLGITDDIRQQRRDEVLSTTTANFKQFADILSQLNDHGRVVVLGSQEGIAAANQQRGGDWLTVQKVL
ncbi:MAG: insulinase family protein [Anaerolineaceae bacterium]|nr:insulinase family protein [Anaerolineaceae bacterium]